MPSSNRIPLEVFLNRGVTLISWQEAGSSQVRKGLPPRWLEIFAQAPSPDAVISEIWQPVIRRARGFVFRLETITIDLKIAVDALTNDLLGLFYLTQSDDPIHGWLAGPPLSEAEPAAIPGSLAAPLPTSIQALFSVHNGLLADGNEAIGIRSFQQLARLSEHAYLDEFDADLGYDRANLLAFAGDGLGNVQCYDLTRETGKGDYLTAAWDHETHELRRSMSFWGFLKDFSIKSLA